MGQIGYLFNLIFTYPIFNALMVLYHLFGDFGLSIIVLTLIIKLVLFPLTLAQLKSMRATQALQPHIAELRRKHGKDQQALALATQELYKEYGINPVAGCLPLFIQLPVLYGLYFALSEVVRSTTHSVKAINDVLYPFVPHFTTFPNINLNWFTFINPAFHISLGSPDPTHILPIIAGLATFIQLRMSQPKTTAATSSGASDPTAQSMKMMQYIMPIFTVFIGWTFPAGLALYWTISSVFQAIQQFFVTGWGSLLVTPNFGGNAGGASNGNGRNNGNGGGGKGNYAVPLSNNQERVQEQVDDDEEGTESEGPVSQRARNGSATARRRSASARRRSSNNTQRKNVSSR